MKQGFTLVEILVTLVIVSVGMLALGSFYTSMISQESIAQERITAVHMAEQLMEDWSASNTPPTPTCKVNGATPTLIVNTGTQNTKTPNCVASVGVPIAYTILLREKAAKAPLPVSHPNTPPNIVQTIANASAAASTPAAKVAAIAAVTTVPKVSMLTMLQLADANQNIIANSSPVMVRSVQVSWTHGTPRTVQLTSITRYTP